MSDFDLDRWIETIGMAMACGNVPCALACIACCCRDIDAAA